MSVTAAGPLRLAIALFAVSRPLSWVNTAFPFAAAYLLSTRQVDAALVVGTVFFLVPYNLAMYGVNDVYDHESDLANPRKGGAEGALVAPAQHRAILITSALLALPFVAWLVAAGGPASWAVLGVALFAVVAYSAPPLRFKEVPFLDSATSSTHFVAPAVYGLALGGAAPTPQLVALLAAFFAWGVASHAFGAVQDVVPDRLAGIGSIATALGARSTVRFALAMWLLAGMLMLATAWPGPLAALLVTPYLLAAWPYRSVTDAASPAANHGWRAFLWINYLAGFAATMLLLWFASITGTTAPGP